MHPEALAFFSDLVFPPLIRPSPHFRGLNDPDRKPWLEGPLRILEIGSHNVNDSLRDIPNLQDIIGPHTWLGLDPRPGRGVDLAVDFLDYNDQAPFDIILCAEALEHCARWRSILTKISLHMHPGSFLALSTAGPLRKPHSCNGGPQPAPGEDYNNIHSFELAQVLSIEFRSYLVTEPRPGLDLAAIAWHPVHPGTPGDP